MSKPVITEKELSHALNVLSIDAKCNTPDFELAAKIFHLVEQRKKVFQIEVSPTHVASGEVEGDVLRNGERNNCWSVYVRRADGMGELIANYTMRIGMLNDDQLAQGKALARAAELSIEHKVPVVWAYAP